ncbi:MAG: histidinol-phosphate transaminase [Oscillospiraceae bacterium]|nr:histidinol-phosphate transaminase [Clostridia bacterium]MBQ9149259.1 histidinol-phosphate transaminase [Oscillospiraceae bacterium]
MSYESDLALRLVPYVAGEQPKNVKLIKLNTNENPYPPSPKVAEAIKGLCDSLRLYPDMEATALREVIAQVNNVEPEMVFCGNGSDEVLAFAFAAFFAGKRLLTPDVTYSFYPVYANLFGVEHQAVPLNADFTVDVEGMLQGCPMALANPNAPTGIELPQSDIRRMAQHAKENDAVLLVDEAYAAFAQETAVPLLKEFDNVLIVRTFSKSHALAGMRVGYAMGSKRLIDALRRIRDSFNSYPLDRLAQAAATASMLDVDYTAKTVALVVAARDRAYARLQAAGIEVLKSATNFLFVKAGEDAAPVQKALRDEGILVRHFGSARLKSWLRVTIGTTEDMEKVTDALIRHIKG